MIGAKFNGVTVKGIGRAKTEQLYFQTLRSSLTSNATFQNVADATIATARSFALHGQNGFTNDDACQVNNAFAAVELGQNDLDCDGIPDSNDPDNDGDGIFDSVDNCPNTSNAGQGDIDGDLAGDACDDDMDNDGVDNGADNCPRVANTDQHDTSGTSSAGDACDDTDHDGVKDGVDNCVFAANSTQHDADGDGRGDACDSDNDNDGVNNNIDNCPLVANTAQADFDRDGLGDACDLCPAVAGGVDDLDHDGIGDDCDPDIDNDLVDNASDNCPRVPNAVQIDSDHDGSGDACDPSPRPGDLDLVAELVLKARGEYFERFRTELYPCVGMRCPTRPGIGFSTQIQMVLDTPMYAQIVDADGKILAHDGPARELALDFAPTTSFEYSRERGDGVAGVGKRYFLETYTTYDTDLAGEYRVLMTGHSDPGRDDGYSGGYGAGYGGYGGYGGDDGGGRDR